MGNIDLSELEVRKKNKLLKSRRHPSLPLSIWSYTDYCQYERAWDEYTLMCRGLVLDDDGNIIARPFPKFFNLDEPDAPPVPEDEGFVVQEKLDGSLIILFMYRGKPVVASRGAFDSPHADMARSLLKRKMKSPGSFFSGTTYLFELIHPNNRIVVNYGDEKNLYFLAIVDNETGFDFYPGGLAGLAVDDAPVVPHYPQYKDIYNLPERSNSEGYVVRFDSGLRFKVKHSEYVKLHRIRFGVTPRRVWEVMRNGEDPTEGLEGVPDEIYDEIKEMVDNIGTDYMFIRSLGMDSWSSMLRELGSEATRKDRALWIKRQDERIQPVLFGMLSGKNYTDVIWKMIKPRGDEA